MKYIIAVFSFVLFLGLPTYAQEDTSADGLGAAGLTPESPFFAVEGIFETVQGWFITNPEAKTQFNIDRANERLAELRTICEDEDKQDRCEQWSKKLSGQFERHMERAQRHMEQFAERMKKRAAQELTNTDIPDAQVEALVEKLTENSLRHQEALQRVYAQVPEQAKEHILDAMENSAQGVSNAIEHIQKNEEAKKFREQLQEQIQEIAPDVRDTVQQRMQNSGLLRAKDQLEENIQDRIQNRLNVISGSEE